MVCMSGLKGLKIPLQVSDPAFSQTREPGKLLSIIHARNIPQIWCLMRPSWGNSFLGKEKAGGRAAASEGGGSGRKEAQAERGKATGAPSLTLRALGWLSPADLLPGVDMHNSGVTFLRRVISRGGKTSIFNSSSFQQRMPSRL